MNQKALEHLHNNEDFAEFAHYLHETREHYIGQLHGAGTELVQQIAGRIASLDDLLRVIRYNDLAQKWRKLKDSPVA